MRKYMTICFAFALTLVSNGCKPGPDPISFGKDQCDFCRMTIADVKYGAELVTEKGRVLKYDAVECLVSDLEDDERNYRQLWAIAYDHPAKLFLVDSLIFVISPEYRSPMGANLAAFAHSSSIAPGLRLMEWEEVRNALSVQ